MPTVTAERRSLDRVRDQLHGQRVLPAGSLARRLHICAARVGWLLALRWARIVVSEPFVSQFSYPSRASSHLPAPAL